MLFCNNSILASGERKQACRSRDTLLVRIRDVLSETHRRSELLRDQFLRNHSPQDDCVAAILASLEASPDLLLLEMLSPDARADLDIMMQAVRKNGLALEYASNELKHHLELVQTAVRQNGLALRFASPEMQRNQEVAKAAVRRYFRAWDFVAAELRSDEEFMIRAV